MDTRISRQQTARLTQVVVDRNRDIADLQNRLVVVSPYEANYRLALVANVAVTEQARENYNLFAAQITQAQKRLVILTTYTTQASLAILQAAREFLQRGGSEALDKAKAEHALISDDIAQVLQPDFDKAAALAARDNLNAIDAAVRFLGNGGLNGHLSAIDALLAAREEVANLVAVAEGDAFGLAEVEGAKERREVEYDEFADCGHMEDLRKLSIALALHANTDDLSFLRGYGFGISYIGQERLHATQTKVDDAPIILVRQGTAPTFRDLFAAEKLMFWGDLDVAGLAIYRALASSLPTLQLSGIYHAMTNMLTDPKTSHPYCSLFDKAGQAALTRSLSDSAASSPAHQLFRQCISRAVDQEAVSEDEIIKFGTQAF